MNTSVPLISRSTWLSSTSVSFEIEENNGWALSATHCVLNINIDNKKYVKYILKLKYSGAKSQATATK